MRLGLRNEIINQLLIPEHELIDDEPYFPSFQTFPLPLPQKSVDHFAASPTLRGLLISVSSSSRIPSDIGMSVTEQRQSESTGSRKALLIGINYVGTEEQLHGSHNDVLLLKNLLLKNGYREEDITVMLDEESAKDGLLFPTEANILRELEKFTKNVNRSDKLLFHFSGHSSQVDQLKDDPERELDSKDEVMVPVDHEDFTKFIRDNELHARLVDPLPPGSYLTAVFDTCHSGTLLDLPHRKCNTRTFFHHELSTDTLSSHSSRVVEGADHSSQSPFLSEFSHHHPRWSSGNSSDGSAQISGHHCHLPANSVWNECSGFQCVESPMECANVISLSSSKDHQLCVEDPDGTSLTVMLVGFLETNPRPRLDVLFQEIARKVHGVLQGALDALRLWEYSHESSQRYSKKKLKKLVNQQPQFCSMNPSRSDDYLDILDPHSASLTE